MPPIVHIMRHGQGFHSHEVTPDGHLLRDPSLTEKGKQQCRDRCTAFDGHDKIELLLASPLRRALQTCQLAFAPCVARGMRIIALPAAEEVSDAPSDTGSPVQDLVAEFGTAVDFTALKLDWFKHEGEYATDAKALNARAAKLRAWIRNRPEAVVAVVSHGFMNHYTTGEVDDQGQQTTPWWEEAELRTYVFKEDGSDALQETEESLARRGMLGRQGDTSLKINQPMHRGEVPNQSFQNPEHKS